MKFEFFWFGAAILAFQTLLLSSYLIITMVGHKIPESRQLRARVATIFFIIGLIFTFFASYGYSIMFYSIDVDNTTPNSKSSNNCENIESSGERAKSKITS